MEAMCGATSVQPLTTVTQCLKALRTLLDDAWPRQQLASNTALCIELLNVLHRLLLTRDNNECFLLLMGVAKQVLVAVQEATDRERQANLRTC